MTEPDDLQLKAELDEIMQRVDSVMKKIEIMMPPADNNPKSSGE